ncbi:MAG: aminotransferase class IV [bacterium]
MNATIAHFFNVDCGKSLADFLPDVKEYRQGIYKCRAVYSSNIFNIEITPYFKRKIEKLKIVNLDACPFLPPGKLFDYSFKYEDRTSIDSLLKGLGDASDILIVKHGLITDTSFSNVILFDGKKWITPDAFLLNGIKRRYLLDCGIITEERVSVNDLKNFQKISLINAMLEPGDIEIDLKDIIY